jgi:putative hemolysin
MRTNKVRITAISLLLTAVLSVCILASPAHAEPNIAAVYCKALGYNYSVESTELGEVGFCTLPDKQKVDAWAFLYGEIGLEWSYCAMEGYEAKHVEDSETCVECTACVLPDGTETEVTQLMGLDWAPVCGDGMCVFPEDSSTCPQDCLQPQPTPKAPNPILSGQGQAGQGTSGQSPLLWVAIGLGIVFIVSVLCILMRTLRKKPAKG